MAVFVYHTVKEPLFNVVKHSGAHSAHLDIQEKAGWILLRVADSGRGADLEQIYSRRGLEPGFGLFSIEERVRSLGGRMTIETVPGGGWITTLSVPKGMASDPIGPELNESGEVGFKSEKKGPVRRPESPEDADSAIRIVVVDDHTVMREGLAGLLNAQTGLELIAQAHSGVEAVALCGNLRPHVVLMGVSMPGMDGIEATGTIVTAYPDVVVLGLSMHDDPATRQGMLDAGAAAVLSKTDAPQTITQEVQRCAGTARPPGPKR